jgi:hypothetical protein
MEKRMSKFHVEVGERARFTKTIGETDVYLFAGITGTSRRIMSTRATWSVRNSVDCKPTAL